MPTSNPTKHETTCLDAALSFARRGIPVLPLAAKRPLVARGVYAASTEKSRIRAWFSRWRTANFGVVTGEASGLLVLDVDPRARGDESLEALLHTLGSLPPTPRVLTGGGGDHLYFLFPERLGSLVGCAAPGIDVKAGGGYVVGPGSVHENGRSYKWAPSSSLDDLPLAALPSRWRDALRRPASNSAHPIGDTARFVPTSEREARAAAYVAKVPPAISGNRGHNATFLLACKLVRGFMLPDEAALRLLRQWNATCQPPWSEAELKRKIHEARTKSGFDWGSMLVSQPRKARR